MVYFILFIRCVHEKLSFRPATLFASIFQILWNFHWPPMPSDTTSRQRLFWFSLVWPLQMAPKITRGIGLLTFHFPRFIVPIWYLFLFELILVIGFVTIPQSRGVVYPIENVIHFSQVYKPSLLCWFQMYLAYSPLISSLGCAYRSFIRVDRL